MHTFSNWLPRDGELFRGSIPAAEHMVQLYDGDASLVDSLEAFVRGGLQAGEGVVVIATADHHAWLEDRLLLHGLDLTSAREQDRYIAVDATVSLVPLLRNGWPREDQFVAFVDDLVRRAGARGRSVRVFGEYVALMWARGRQNEALRLEQIWHKLCARHGFPLFCAYPRSVLAKGKRALTSTDAVCAAHTTVIS